MSKNIHPTAFVEEGAKLGKNVKIGPYCMVGKDVVLADNVELKSNVILENKVFVGDSTTIYSFAVIGSDPQNLRYKGVGAEVIIGKNNVLREYVTINLGTEGGIMSTRVGDNCFIMTAAHIAHDCIVGNNVIMANNATLGGHVHVEDFVTIGGMTAVHQFVRIGQYAMIGGMSGIERDVAPFTLVKGERAYMSGLNLVGLQRNGFSDADIIALREAYNTIYERSDSMAQGIAQLSSMQIGHNKCVLQVLDFLRSNSTRGVCRPK